MSVRGLKPLDYAAVAIAVAVTAFSTALVYTGSGAERRVIIQGTGGSWIFPPDAEERITVPGPLGDTVVELGDGRARIYSSPCGNQTCVSARAIQTHGQWLVCLPNGVVVRIEGRGLSPEEDGDLDGIAW